jgi:hypothetical protein
MMISKLRKVHVLHDKYYIDENKEAKWKHCCLGVLDSGKELLILTWNHISLHTTPTR